VTAEEYGRLLYRIRDEVETASAAFYAAEEINRFALENEANYGKLNRDARFWNLQVHALKTAYLMGLGRLFDKRRDAHSMMELLRATETYPGYFSKAALLERKQRTSGQELEVIERTLDGMWEPKSEELKQISAELDRSCQCYRERYENIRHTIFAHIGKDERLIVDTLDKTLWTDIDLMFLDLLEVMDALHALFDNGVKHDRRIGPHRYAREVQCRTRDVLNRL
jgi:AbiU2